MSKKLIIVILIWIACAPATYLLMKRDWTRLRHVTYGSHSHIIRNAWTTGDRSRTLVVSAAGPGALVGAIFVSIAHTLPESDPNQKASW